MNVKNSLDAWYYIYKSIFLTVTDRLPKILVSVWPEVVFYHQSGVLGHLCGAEILAVVFSLKRVTFQF